MDGHDVGQVCLNGHPANAYHTSIPDNSKPFCPTCGEKTIVACPECNKRIRGKTISDWSVYVPPAYCEHCGSPFPWTSRAIQAATDLADVELEDQADKEVFGQNVGELTKDSPQTKVAAARIRKIVARAGGAFGETLRDILVDIASETAKKALWG